MLKQNTMLETAFLRKHRVRQFVLFSLSSFLILTVATISYLMYGCASTDKKVPANSFVVANRTMAGMLNAVNDEKRTSASRVAQSVTDLKSLTKDFYLTSDGEIACGDYTIYFDFSPLSDDLRDAVLPPAIALPTKLMKKYPRQDYPVLLIRPEDNRIGTIRCTLHLNFLSWQDCERFFEKGFEYKKMLQIYDFEDKSAENNWPLYDQAKLVKYYEEKSNER